eukprot:scaffold35225_cov183-Amphora_coffeaeformis.AAC.1
MENSGGNSNLDSVVFGLVISVLCKVTEGKVVAVVAGTFSFPDAGDFLSDTDLYKSPKCSLGSIGLGRGAS